MRISYTVLNVHKLFTYVDMKLRSGKLALWNTGNIPLVTPCNWFSSLQLPYSSCVPVTLNWSTVTLYTMALPKWAGRDQNYGRRNNFLGLDSVRKAANICKTCFVLIIVVSNFPPFKRPDYRLLLSPSAYLLVLLIYLSRSLQILLGW
jgi:hypothetical protein